MQHSLIDFNPFDKTINIRSFNKHIDINDDKFWFTQLLISEILKCSISINRNKLVSLDNVGNGAAISVDIATVDWIINAEQWTPSKSEYSFGNAKPVTLKSGNNEIPVLAIPLEIILNEKYAIPDNYVQLIQMVLVTEPDDVGLVGFILKLLRLTL